MTEYVWRGLLKRPYRLKKIIDHGKGERILVLIHGLGARADYWDPLVNVIDPNIYRVIAYDLLGFGTSPKPGFAKYSVEEHAKAIFKSLSKDLKSNQTYTVIGHSMGCIICTHVATKKPKNVERVILYQPPLLIDSKGRTRLRRSFYEYLAKRPMLVTSYLRVINVFTDKFSTVHSSDEEWLPFERSLRNTIIAQNTLDELKNLKQQTDIIYGRFDMVVSKVDAKKMAQINKHIKLHYVNEMHDITEKSAKYLNKLLEAV